MKNQIDTFIKAFSADKYLLNPFAFSLKMSLESISEGIPRALEELSAYLCCYDIQLFDKNYNCIASIRGQNPTITDLVTLYAKPSKPVYTEAIIDGGKIRKINIFSVTTQNNLYYIAFIDNDIISQAETEEIILITQATMLVVLTNYERLSMLNSVATRDSLTGVFNRLAYQLKLEQLGHEKITFILADLFRLKKINDQFGHFVGDKYIISAAQALNTFFQNSVYRIGGDEFAIISFDEEIDVDALMDAANKKLSITMEKEFGEVDIFHLNYGFEVGADQDAEVFYRQADQNLSRDKSNFYKNHNIDRRG